MKSKTTSATTFKILFSRLLCCLIIFTSIIMNAGAQVVNANLIITPPYSVYFRDYSGYGKTNNMLLSVNSTTNRKVYLAGSVTKDDNSIVISVKDKYRPLVPTFITANVPLMLNGLQLRNIFGNGTTDDLNLTGLTANDIGLNQALPEGSYTFCIKVKDYDTREVISTACKTIFVTYSDPPQIISPFNGSAVQGFNPQMMMVTWQNTAPTVFGITYRLKMVKLIKGITPLDALNSNVQLLLNKGNLTTTNYPLDVASGIKLETGQTYAMQVIAQSPTAFFKNAGKSEVTTFFYKGQNSFDINNLKLHFLNPVAQKGKDTIEVNSEKPFVLSWNLLEGNSLGTAKQYGVVKYVVKITPGANPSGKKPTDKNFSFETGISPDIKNDILPNSIIYKEEVADKIGFKNKYWYTATVSAYDKNDQLIVKNSSVDFQYKKNFNLIFLNPIANKGSDNIIEVNNEKPLKISWNVFEGDLASKKEIVLDSYTGKKYGIVKYNINITPALNAEKLSDKKFSYSTSTVAVKDSLSSAIAISEANADKAGFKENHWYNITVKGYDKNNEEVVKNTSVDFQYSKIKDNEIYVNTTARAVIKYAFQGFPEIYNAANTPVQVEVLQKKPTFSMNSDDPPPSTSKSVIKIGDVIYYTLGKFSASTQKNGEVEVKLKIPVNDISKEDIYYRLRLQGAYYVDQAFKLLSTKAPVKDKVSNKDTSIINFGQLVAQTYGYSLKVNVSKAYPSYSISNSTGKIMLSDKKFEPGAKEYVTTKEGITYNVAKTKAVAGITIALYRKDKKLYVPPVEGKLTPADAAEYGFVEVARAKTTIAKDDKGNDISFVKFDKLLSNINSGDEYFIVALNDKESIPGQSNTNSSQTSSGSSRNNNSDPRNNGQSNRNSSQTGSGSSRNNNTDFRNDIQSNTNFLQTSGGSSGNNNSNLTNNGQSNTNFLQTGGGSSTNYSYINPYAGSVYKDAEFVATEKVYKLPLPININQPDAMYRNVSVDYNITSTKPPTSLIKGRLQYTWKSDASQQIRPMAKTKFNVIVDYLVNGKSISAIYGKNNNKEKVVAADGNEDITKQYITFGTEYDKIQLLDFGKVMATGTTDDQGNFELEVVNLNKKGDIGIGQYSGKIPDQAPDKNRFSNKAPKPIKTAPGTSPADIVKAIEKMRIKDQELNPEEISNLSKLKEQMTGNVLEGLTSNKLEELMNGLTQNGLLKGNIVEGLLNGIRQGGLPVSESVDQFSSNDNGAGIDLIEGILDNTPDLQAALNTGMDVEKVDDGFKVNTGITGNIGKGGKGVEKVAETKKATNKYRGPNENLGNENEDLDEKIEDEKYAGSNFVRVYRIVPLNDNFYPTKETLEVQPFEASAFMPYTSFVKEVKVTVFAKDINNGTPLPEVLITVFRSIGDKTEDLPAGEGDGQYKQDVLKNPQYKGRGNTSEMLQVNKLDQNTIFETKFEYLFKSTEVGAKGATFTTLLSNFNNYYIQASSDPTKTSTNSNSYYTATISAITPEKYDDPDFWDGTNSPKALADITMLLKPLASRAFIRVIDNATGSSIPQGKIKVSGPGSSWFSPDRTIITDVDGYAEIKVSDPALKNYLSPVKETKIGFAGEANGYEPSKVLEKTFTPSGTGQQFVEIIPLNPAGKMKGRLVSADENKKGIEGYIITPSGKVYPTAWDGTFKILIAPISGDTIKIIPKDVAYFDTAYIIKRSDADKINLEEISIYRRKHRIRFVVTNENGRKVEDAIITSGTMVPEKGTTDFVFENVSVNNYTFVIRGKNGSNYIPITKNIKNEESKKFVTHYVTLEKGSEITGSVNMDGKPVKNARVYIDADAKEQPAANNGKPSGQITDDANLIQAFTDANGKYTLHGVPVNNQKIDLLATLDTNFTVSGDRKKADIVNKKATTDFNLTAYKNFVITNLHGFPLTVEKIELVKDELRVSGLVHWTKSVSNFSLNEINEVIRVEDVRYKLLPALIGNKKIASAIENKITLEGSPVLKLKYLDKYNVKLTGSSNPFDMDPLFISKEGDYGVIKGMIQIVDNSFNYPSSYLSFKEKNESFFFAQKEAGGITNVLSSVKSAITISDASSGNYTDDKAFREMVDKINGEKSNANNDKPDYYLSNAAGENIKFKFIGFDAQADAANSFIDKQGKIHLNITLDCKIKNSQPENFKVNLKDVVLDNNKVYAAKGSPIEVKLEEWTLSVKDWELSPEQGGITSSKGLIKTAKVDIPFSTFLLRSDMFNFDDFDASQLQMGGGIVTLQVNAAAAAAKPRVLWDNNTGSGKGHWRFSMSGIKDPVAKITGLEGINGDIEIDYMHILSDNSSVFQLKQSNTPLLIRNNSLAKFYPQAIANGPGYFKISGGLNVGAPRMGDMLLELSYTLQNGVVKMKPSNVLTDFEGKGFVHFVTLAEDKNQTGKEPNITITENEIKIRGEVIEKPSKSFTPIPANFIATTSNNSYKVDLPANHVMQLTSASKGNAADGYKLTLAKGGMEVSGGDWGTLSFEGTMESNSTKDKGIKPTYMNFNVLGDISVDAKGAKMDNIETPFGNMTMIFDFAAKRLIGKLEVDRVQMGTNIISGTVETLFDPQGFYVAGGGTAEIKIGNPIADGTYNLGFMIGSYPITTESSLWKTVTAYKQPEVKNDCFVNKINGKLAGFYLSVDRLIFDLDYSFDFVIVSGFVNGKALAGVDMWVNFSGDLAMGVAVKVFAKAAAGMGSYTGTSLSGSVTALAALKLEYLQSKFVVQGSIDMSFGVTVSQNLVFTTVSASKNVGCSAQGGTQGFSFELTNGGPIKACY